MRRLPWRGTVHDVVRYFAQWHLWHLLTMWSNDHGLQLDCDAESVLEAYRLHLQLTCWTGFFTEPHSHGINRVPAYCLDTSTSGEETDKQKVILCLSTMYVMYR